MRKIVTFFTFSLLLLLATSMQAQQVYDYVVAKDGSGDFTTLKEAITAADNNGKIIFIKKGTYREKVDITKRNITLIGQHAENVIFVWNGSGGVDGTSESYTIRVNGENFYAENITFSNDYGVGSQAVALSVRSDKAAFKNCRLLSFQDTHYIHSNSARQYYKDCFIEGGTDFIFGGAIAVFDDCHINCMKGGYYITAPANNDYDYGMVFRDCEITANSDVPASNGYLGRPWKDNGKTVWLNCKMGNHIRPVGWSRWTTDTSSDDYDNAETGFYAEYKSTDLNGVLVSTSSRAAWSKQLTDAEAGQYTLNNIFGNKGYASSVWNPLPLIVSPDKVLNLNVASKQATWDAVAEAKGYVITRNNKVVGFSTTNSFTDESASETTGYTYSVQAVSTRGNLGEKSDDFLVNGGANDQEAPSVPANVKAVEAADYTIRISWDASTDNEGVAGYTVYKNGEELATVVSDLHYDDVIPLKGRDQNISYTVLAFDDTGNASAQSTGMIAKAKTALIDENFSNWNEYTDENTTTTVTFYGAGIERTASLEKCQVLPNQNFSTTATPIGSTGAIRIGGNGGVLAFSELEGIGSFQFNAALDVLAEASIVVEKNEGTSWVEVKTVSIAQLSSEYSVSELRQAASAQVRLRNAGSTPVYIHDVYAAVYVPGTDPYPTDYKTGDILIEEDFSGQDWADRMEGGEVLAASVFVPEVILGVMREIEITKGSKILPEHAPSGSATEASKGAIYLEKPGRDSYVVLPELPSCANITAVWGLPNATNRTLKMEKYENGAWTTVTEANADGDKRQGILSHNFNTESPITLRLSNGNGTGAIYLHDLKVTAYKAGSGIAGEQLSSNYLLTNKIKDCILLTNADQLNTVTIYSLSGQAVKSYAASATIDVPSLNSGYYILQIVAKDGKTFYEKVMKY